MGEEEQNAIRRSNRLKQRNQQLRENVNRNVDRSTHNADNPDYSIGTHERMWTHHKWVDRKRGPDGKWIYDYGNGYGNPDRESIKKNNDEIHRANEKARSLHTKLQNEYEKDYKAHPLNNPTKATKLYLRDFLRNVGSARIRVSNMAKRTVRSGREWIARTF